MVLANRPGTQAYGINILPGLQYRRDYLDCISPARSCTVSCNGAMTDSRSSGRAECIGKWRGDAYAGVSNLSYSGAAIIYYVVPGNRHVVWNIVHRIDL